MNFPRLHQNCTGRVMWIAFSEPLGRQCRFQCYALFQMCRCTRTLVKDCIPLSVSQNIVLHTATRKFSSIPRATKSFHRGYKEEFCGSQYWLLYWFRQLLLSHLRSEVWGYTCPIRIDCISLSQIACIRDIFHIIAPLLLAHHPKICQDWDIFEQ